MLTRYWGELGTISLPEEMLIAQPVHRDPDTAFHPLLLAAVVTSPLLVIALTLGVALLVAL